MNFYFCPKCKAKLHIDFYTMSMAIRWNYVSRCNKCDIKYKLYEDCVVFDNCVEIDYYPTVIERNKALKGHK